ncbi:hypothetical protein C0J52_12168 [Blattella germanica]|nr:hypothetical protein C0J52_12168 [Blattella germanica]
MTVYSAICVLQTKADVTEMEQIQRHPSEMERQNSTQQRDLALLAYAVKQNTLVCQFASPLDVNMHDKPEAVVLEGKYWKRKLAAVTAEYKKWRMFYRNRAMGWSSKDGTDMCTDMFDWQPHSNDSVHSMGSMMVDEDYMEFMTDTLFSTIQQNQPFAFPDPREISRNADLLSTKLPSVPEECVAEEIFRTRGLGGPGYLELEPLPLEQPTSQSHLQQQQQPQSQSQPQQAGSPLQYTATIFAQPQTDTFQPSGPSAFSQAAAQPSYEEIISLRSSQRSHLQQQKPSQQAVSPRIPQQQSAIFQQPPPPPPPPQQSQQVILSAAPQCQPFNIVDTISPSHSPPSHPSPAPQLPSYSMSQSFKPPQQSYHRASPQQQQSYSNFHLPSPPQSSQSPTEHRQSPTLKGASNRSNSLPGPQDDTFIMPKGCTITESDCQYVMGWLEVLYNQLKQRNRSRSGSSLVSAGVQQQQQQRQLPLVSHASDPALATPNPPPPTTSGTSTLQPLLAQLLTTNSIGVYNFIGAQDKGIGRPQSMVPILPAPAPVSSQSATALLITTSSPVTVGPSMAHVSNQLLHPLGVANTSNLGKGSDSPSDSSNVASPAGLSLSPLASPLNMTSPGPLSPPKSSQLHSRAEDHSQSRRKLSKAAMLQKGADYIRQLRGERSQLREEMDSLRQQIDNCQAMLPATGAPVSRQRATVLNSLRYLCTATDILSDPSRLPEEARQAVLKQASPDQRPNGTH